MSTANNPLELINALAELNKGMHGILQDAYFDSLAMLKRAQLGKKLEGGLFDRVTHVYVGEHLKHALPVNSDRRYTHLAPGFLTDSDLRLQPGSAVLLTNNDIGRNLPQFVEWYNRSPDLLFIVWDWDAQHWLQMSAIVAMNADIYVSAASDNTFLLSHFNPCVIGPIFVGIHQWSRRFVVDNFQVLLEPRCNEPFGPHVPYGNFPRRNRAVATVTKTFPSVHFTDNQYKARSELENLREWAAHKSHWIAPVLGGVPIRVFNALMVGGIPIVPSFYRNLPEVALLEDIPVYYEVGDLLDPRAVNAQAVAKFDAAGESGLIGRVARALDRHHVDARCEQILTGTEGLIAAIRSGDRSYGAGYVSTRF